MKTVQIPSFYLIGIAVRTTNENGQAAKDIPALWNTFHTQQLVDKIPNKVNDTVYSLYTDYEGDYTKPYTTILGCEVSNISEIPDGMVGQFFEGGKYMEIVAKGDLMEGLIINHWKEIWNMDLKRRYTADFEKYGENAQNPNQAEVPILVAIQ